MCDGALRALAARRRIAEWLRVRIADAVAHDSHTLHTATLVTCRDPFAQLTDNAPFLAALHVQHKFADCVEPNREFT